VPTQRVGSDDPNEATRQLAHDLRNVLVSLQSVAAAIDRVLPPRDGALAAQLALVVERAASLSRRLAAGGDADLLAQERQCCRISTALLRSRPLLEHVADPVPIELCVEERAGMVDLSEEALERIAINLVRNARRAAGSAGAIEVTLQRSIDDHDDAWDTLIVDNPDPRPRVSRSWSRIDDGEIRPGLGLTIVRELAACAGGRLELWRATTGVVRVACVFPVRRVASDER
jgi:signal transduction histidine kinase